MKWIDRMRRNSPRAALALSLGFVLVLSPLAGGCKKEKGGAKKNGDGNPQAQTPATQPDGLDGAVPASPYDIIANPTILADPNVTPAQYELYGVKLGDPRTALFANGVAGEPDEGGWVGHRGQGEVFRLEDGKVVAMQIADDAVLAKLGLKAEQDVVTKFGAPNPPADTDPKNAEVLYTYKDRDLTVRWDRKAAPSGKVTVITIGS